MSSYFHGRSDEIGHARGVTWDELELNFDRLTAGLGGTLHGAILSFTKGRCGVGTEPSPPHSLSATRSVLSALLS